jgi:DNA-binding NarL/FixJ family response regulator
MEEMMEQQPVELKALIVDDHMIARASMEGLLKKLGITQIDQAANVQEATGRMAENAYNVVFLDWNMPGRSGYNLLQQCRQDSAYDRVAFVIVSSESEERYIIEALKAGSTSYIVKPVSESVLKDHVNRVMTWIKQRSGE